MHNFHTWEGGKFGLLAKIFTLVRREGEGVISMAHNKYKKLDTP
jgi:hypothetical protein